MELTPTFAANWRPVSFSARRATRRRCPSNSLDATSVRGSRADSPAGSSWLTSSGGLEPTAIYADPNNASDIIISQNLGVGTGYKWMLAFSNNGGQTFSTIASDTTGTNPSKAWIAGTLQDFLLELGRGFCFEARQKRIVIGGEHYFVDLVEVHIHTKFHANEGSFRGSNVEKIDIFHHFGFF